MLEHSPIFVSPSNTRIPVGVSPRLEGVVKEEGEGEEDEEEKKEEEEEKGEEEKEEEEEEEEV